MSDPSIKKAIPACHEPRRRADGSDLRAEVQLPLRGVATSGDVLANAELAPGACLKGGLLQHPEGARGKAGAGLMLLLQANRRDPGAEILPRCPDTAEAARSARRGSVLPDAAYLPEEITQTLRRTPPWLRDDLARRLVERASGQQLDAMSLEAQNALVEAIVSGYYSDADRAALETLYAHATEDPAFTAAEREVERRVIAAVRGVLDYRATRARWPSIPDQERGAILQRVVDAVMAALGLAPLRIQTFSKPKAYLASLCEVRPLYGYVDDGDLFLNVHPDAAGDFKEALDTAVHEAGHLYQDALLHRLEARAIEPGDPRFDMARALALNKRRGVQPTVNYEAYFSQPREQHTRAFTARVLAALAEEG